MRILLPVPALIGCAVSILSQAASWSPTPSRAISGGTIALSTGSVDPVYDPLMDTLLTACGSTNLLA